MGITIEELQLGRNGSYTVESGDGEVDLTALWSGEDNFVCLVVIAAATFTTLTDNQDTNMVSESNRGSVSYPVGTIISPRKQKRFKTIELSAGSVELYAG